MQSNSLLKGVCYTIPENLVDLIINILASSSEILLFVLDRKNTLGLVFHNVILKYITLKIKRPAHYLTPLSCSLFLFLWSKVKVLLMRRLVLWFWVSVI